MRRRIKTASMSVRISFGVLMAFALITLLWLDHSFKYTALPLTSVILLLVLASFVELLAMLKTKGVEMLWFSGMIGCAAMATCPFWWKYLEFGANPDGLQMLMLMALILMMIFVDQMFQQAPEMALLRIAGTALAVLYLGVGSALVLTIRIAYDVPMFVLFLSAVKFTDIGAYFVGSLIGRHKLVPRLSARKTWEGLFGGLVCSAVGSVIVLLLLKHITPEDAPRMMIFQAAVFGVIVGLAGQFSDLCESLLKRSAHVKDSGAVVPEFGGVLDIVDSLFFAAPVGIVFLSVMD